MPTTQGIDTSVITPVGATAPADSAEQTATTQWSSPPEPVEPAAAPAAQVAAAATTPPMAPPVTPEPPALKVSSPLADPAPSTPTPPAASLSPALTPITTTGAATAAALPDAFSLSTPTNTASTDPLPDQPDIATTPVAATTPAITNFPDAAQMLSELQASGSLEPTQASAAPPGQNLPLPAAQAPQSSTPLAVHLANTTQIFHRPTAEQLLHRAESSSKPGRNYIMWIIGAVIVLGGIGWIVYSQMRMSGQSAQEVMSDGLGTVSPSNP